MTVGFLYQRVRNSLSCLVLLTHWGRVTHICASGLPTIGSDNGLSPGRRQNIIWNNAGILLIGPLWTKFREILIDNPIFSFKKMRLKVSSAKWRPFCLGLNVLSPMDYLHECNIDCHYITQHPWFVCTKLSPYPSWLIWYSSIYHKRFRTS